MKRKETLRRTQRKGSWDIKKREGMGTVTIRSLEAENLFRITLLCEGNEAIHLECPKPFNASDHFTIFWCGRAHCEDLYRFVNRSYYPRDEILSTLFFFPETKLRFPARPVKIVPSPLDLAAIEEYTLPRFLRYEIYPGRISGNNLRQSRCVVWAAISSTPQQLADEKESKNEIGVFTTLQEFETKSMKDAIQELIDKTIKPELQSDTSAVLLDHVSQILKDKVV